MRKVPKLRFKEFSDEWEEKKLGDLILLQRGSSPRPIIKYITNSSDGVNWIKIGDTNKESKYITSTSEKITKEGAKKSREVKKGEIILSNSMSYGRPFILKIDGYIHDGWFVIRKYEENFNKEFLCQLLGSDFVQLQYKKVAAGGVVENISSELVNSVKVKVLSLKEQEKIANFLSNIDKKISLTEEKLELFREYKKGVMQKIFSQELRFKDNNGNDYPEWEEKKLGEIGDTYNGLTGKSAEDFGRGKKYITYKNIYDNTKINMNILELVNIELGEKQNKVEYGDIFFTTSSETPNEVGYSSVLLDKIQEDIYLNSFCFGFRLKNKVKYLPEFFRYLLRSKNFRTFIYILAQGSTRFNLSKIELLKLKVLLPSLEEQQKIADFLSSIDSKIESIEKELEGLKEFKRGLLQQMFV